MNRPSPPIRRLAKRLMTYERSRTISIKTSPPAVIGVCENLRPHLAELMGNGGYQALLSRAIVLASVDTPWLSKVRVNADGALEGLEEPRVQLPSDEFFDGNCVMVAHLLSLLDAFIGGLLTRQLVREAWPQLSSNDSDGLTRSGQ